MKNCPQLRQQKAEIVELKAQLVQKDVVGQRLQNQVVDLQKDIVRRRNTNQRLERMISRGCEKYRQTEKHDASRSEAYRITATASLEKDKIIEDMRIRLGRMDTEVCRRADAYRNLDEKLKRVQGNLNHELEIVKRNTGATIDALVSQVGKLEEDKKELTSKVSQYKAAIVINNNTFRLNEKHTKARDSEILTMAGVIHNLRTQIEAKKTPELKTPEIVVKCYHVGGAIGCSLVREKNKQLAKLEAKLSDANAARKAANMNVSITERRLKELKTKVAACCSPTVGVYRIGKHTCGIPCHKQEE